MSRRAAIITQADVARAIRAADQAGSGRVVEVTPAGIIRIVPAEPTRPPAPATVPAPQPPALDDERPIEL